MHIAYAASFKPTSKSLWPSEAKFQLCHWVNMGVALLGFPHSTIKKMSSLGNRLFIPLGRSVACAKFQNCLEICRYKTLQEKNVRK